MRSAKYSGLFCALLLTHGTACFSFIEFSAPKECVWKAQSGSKESCNDPKQISAGGSHTCLVRFDKTAWCWGNNTSHQLGLFAKTEIITSHIPQKVAFARHSETQEQITYISAGQEHTCAINGDAVYCWGANDHGQSGVEPNIDSGDVAVPFEVENTRGKEWVMVSAGGTHTCALSTDGTVWCWGGNQNGQVDAELTDSVVVLPVRKDLGQNNPMEWVSAGLEHTCAHNGRNIYCWGNPTSGKTGRKFDTSQNTFESMEPSQLSRKWSVGSTILDLDAGREHSCALVDDGDIYCWGSSKEGQFLALGTSTSTNSDPSEVLEDNNMRQIGSGRFHTCALSSKDSEPYCWGGNQNNQLGDALNQDRVNPRPVAGSLLDVEQLSVGSEHACALKRKTGEISCWGLNEFGQAGQPWKEGDQNRQRTVASPTLVLLPDQDTQPTDASVITDLGGSNDADGSMMPVLDAGVFDSGYVVDIGLHPNRAPGAPTISISPSIPTTQDNLRCTITSTSIDLDGDNVTYAYAWKLNGLATTSTRSTVSSTISSSGDEWTCIVTPNDGTIDGDQGEDTVTILVPPDSCESILTSNASAADGIYRIDPDGIGAQADFDVYCQMIKGGIPWLQSTVNDLYFMRSEVTVTQYEACVNAEACTDNGYASNSSNSVCNYGNTARADHPMNCLTDVGAGEFCAWVGARLPTTDEWEAEASNGGQRKYPWGDTPEASCDHCIMNDMSPGCNSGFTFPVCSKPLGNSASGVCDLMGNVWEWTSTPSAREPEEWVVRGGSFVNDDSFMGQGSALSSRAQRTESWWGFGGRCVSASLPGTNRCASSEVYGEDCWPVVPTRINICSNTSTAVPCATLGSPPSCMNLYCGQDAHYPAQHVQEFTCVSDAGQDYPDCSQANGVQDTIRDELTGLIWQRNQLPAMPSDWMTAVNYCDASTYAGHTDWRLPKVHELRSIVDYGSTATVAVDASVFLGTEPKRYWTSVSVPNSSNQAICIRFDEGRHQWHDKTSSTQTYTRCVRSSSPGSGFPANRFLVGRNNSGSIITDSLTGLMWQSQSTAPSVTWDSALNHCEDLSYAGYNDWRLPDLNSLMSLIDYTLVGAVTSLPGTGNAPFWSSSPFLLDNSAPTKAWYVHFGTGDSYFRNMDDGLPTRCVR